MSYLVHLRQFEGPLGLLLYLIRKEEMDVLDINVNEITRQYLDYIRMMKELDLELAGEFVSMAATLIHIKSRMLLPQYNEEGEVVETEDPRKELVQKLLEYQKYQEAAKKLYDRPLLGRDVFVRGLREKQVLEGEQIGDIIIEGEGLFSLISSYRRALRKAKRMVHQVRPKVQSIAARVMEIKERLIVGTRVLLRDLLAMGSAPPRAQLLVTFLSMLELGRMGYVSLFQSEVYGDIHIETLKPIERNVLERVQEFEIPDVDAVVANLINEANEQQIDREMDLAEKGLEIAPQLELGILGEESIPEELIAAENFAESEAAAEAAGGQNISSESNEAEHDLAAPIDIATDDDILAAERELEAHESGSDHGSDHGLDV